MVMKFFYTNASVLKFTEQVHRKVSQLNINCVPCADSMQHCSTTFLVSQYGHT